MNRYLIGKLKKCGAHHDETAKILKGLEGMREEIGPLAEELIDLLREGSTPPAITGRPTQKRPGHRH